MELRFYYDVVCPYAYTAATRIQGLADRFGGEVRWIPTLLGGIYRSIGAPDYPVSPPARARYNALDLFRQAELAGLALEMPAAHPRRTVDAMRLLCAAPDDVRPALSLDLYAAYWRRGEDVADRQVLAGYAAKYGVDPAQLSAPAVKQRLFDNTAAAVGEGAFGVPTIGVGERFWWGNDRLHLVARALGASQAEAAQYAGGVTPSIATAPRAGGAPRITFFHDFASPFSYLASTQIERIAAAHGAELEVVPFLLGALFSQIGTPMVPLMEMPPPKQRFAGQDLQDWAAWWGVDFRWPTTFPLRTVAPLRVALQEPKATGAIYKAAWADDLNIGDPAVLGGVLDRAGFDGAALLAGCQDPAIKAQLRANTDRAREAGVCGVPTCQIDGRLFWGQDRLPQVEAALVGWTPTH